MKITCISDLHGHYPSLFGGDLLIVAGDLTARDIASQHLDFIEWIKKQPYKKKLVIGGNHDVFIDKLKSPYLHDIQTFVDGMEYLCDSGTEFEEFKIWGSPWTKRFEGMNPQCMAFTCDTDEQLADKWALIPDDIDILITHSPAYGNFDINIKGNSVGSMSLFEKVSKIKPKLFVFGHVHESYGHGLRKYTNTIYVNASHVNEKYQPVNPPIEIEL